MTFEWDESKREANLKKHGLDFVDVPSIIEGETLSFIDERKEYGEERFITAGLLRDFVVIVAHTETDEVIRIISARRATKNEEKEYFKEFAN